MLLRVTEKCYIRIHSFQIAPKARVCTVLEATRPRDLGLRPRRVGSRGKNTWGSDHVSMWCVVLGVTGVRMLRRWHACAMCSIFCPRAGPVTVAAISPGRAWRRSGVKELPRSGSCATSALCQRADLESAGALRRKASYGNARQRAVIRRGLVRKCTVTRGNPPGPCTEMYGSAR